MSKQEERYQKRRLRSAYVTSVISITLVLFLLGIQGLIMIYAQKLSSYVRENIGLTVVLNEKTKEADIIKLQKTFDAAPYVKSTEYITQEQAAEKLTQELGEDFIGFIGYNPLLPSIEIRVYADYANNDSLSKFEEQLLALPEVNEVYYQKDLVQSINDNLRHISLILLSCCVILLFIAIALVNNTVRLMVYSKRLLIKSMQLVGATSRFIRKPFVAKGVVQGVLAAALASILLFVAISFLQKRIPELVSLQDIDLFLILCGILVVMGILFTWISSFFAVRKFLRMNSDHINF